MKVNKREKRVQIEIDDQDSYYYEDYGRSLSEIRGDDLLDLLRKLGLKTVSHKQFQPIYYDWIKFLDQRY